MRRGAAFAWDFVVGDDWVGAAGVAVILLACWLLAHLGHVAAWWLVPPGVVATLAATLRRALPARLPR
jgi:hypothetical protein